MTAAWTRKEGKSPTGGLNAKGRASYKGGTLKAPVKAGDNPRRASFLARMGGMPGPERKPDGSPTRLLLSLQAWGAVLRLMLSQRLQQYLRETRVRNDSRKRR
jgi:hypothetical protein